MALNAPGIPLGLAAGAGAAGGFAQSLQAALQEASQNAIMQRRMDALQQINQGRNQTREDMLAQQLAAKAQQGYRPVSEWRLLDKQGLLKNVPDTDPDGSPHMLSPQEQQWFMQQTKPQAAGRGKGAAMGDLTKDEKQKIADITAAYTNTQQMQQYWNDGQLSKKNPILGKLMTTALGDNAIGANMDPATAKYWQSGKEWSNNYTKATMGRTSEGLIQDSRSQIPGPGTDDAVAQPKFNEMLNTLKGKAQGLINARAGDPQGQAMLKQQLKGMFGDFVLQTPSPGVSTNFQATKDAMSQPVPQGGGGGMDKPTAQKVYQDWKVNPAPFSSDPDHINALKQAQQAAPELGWQ